jgi:hypothetical protein
MTKQSFNRHIIKYNFSQKLTDHVRVGAITSLEWLCPECAADLIFCTCAAFRLQCFAADPWVRRVLLGYSQACGHAPVAHGEQAEE